MIGDETSAGKEQQPQTPAERPANQRPWTHLVWDVPRRSAFEGAGGRWLRLWDALVDSAKAAGVEVIEDDALHETHPGVFLCRLNGDFCQIDLRDYPDFRDWAPNAKLVLVARHTRVMQAWPQAVGLFPGLTVSWEEFERRRAEFRWDPDPNYFLIACAARLNQPTPTLIRRLHVADVATTITARFEVLPDGDPRFFRKAQHAQAVIYVARRHAHALEPRALETMGLGVPLISQEIWETCGDRRPLPGVDYIPLADDLVDVWSVLMRIRRDPGWVRPIAEGGRAYFDAFAQPEALWKAILARWCVPRVPRHVILDGQAWAPYEDPLRPWIRKMVEFGLSRPEMARLFFALEARRWAVVYRQPLE